MVADVIVIGAGWGGLTTAAILAHAGLEVKVLEATGHVGGRAACDRKDGFLVDYGVHIITYERAGSAAAALRQIGYDIDFVSYGKPLLFFEGQFIPLPTGAGSFLQTPIVSWTDKLIIAHGLRRLLFSRVGRFTDTPIEQFMPGAGREAIEEFYRILATSGLAIPTIEIASAGSFAKFLRRALLSREKVAYPRGGMLQINNALSEKIMESGEISFNSRVKALIVENGKVESVKVREEDLRARAVVLAIPAQNIPGLVADGLDNEFKKKCASLIPTAGISIDLCLNKPVSDIDGVFLTVDPILVCQFTSNVDPSTAPEGKQLATFYYPLPQEVMNDKARLKAEEDRSMAKINDMFPGIMDHVEWERVLRLAMIDGFEPRIGQTAKDRPGVRVQGVDNLFLSGDCVSAEGKGGDVAFASGVEAANAVLDFLK